MLMDIKSVLLVVAVISLAGLAYFSKSSSVNFGQLNLPSLNGYSLPSFMHQKRTVPVSLSWNGAISGTGKSRGWANFSFTEKTDIGGGIRLIGNVSLLLNCKTSLPDHFEGKVMGISSGIEAPVSADVNFTRAGSFPYAGNVVINGTGVAHVNGNSYNFSYAELTNFNGTIESSGSLSGMASQIRLVGKSEVSIKSR